MTKGGIRGPVSSSHKDTSILGRSEFGVYGLFRLGGHLSECDAEN